MAFRNHSQPSGNPVPQWEPLIGQSKNKAKGYSYEVTDEVRLLRFLILGSEGGTYYTSESELKRENVQCIDRYICIDK